MGILSSRPWKQIIFGTSLAIAAGSLLAPAVSAENSSKHIQEIYYGELLFHYFQQDHLTALTKTQAFLKQEKLSAHQQDAQLLDANISVNYGLFKHAQVLLEQIVSEQQNQAVSAKNKQLAWLYLAKTALAYNLPKQANIALTQPNDLLTTSQQAESLYLRSQTIQTEQQFNAIKQQLQPLLTGIGSEDSMPHLIWYDYTLYNLAVAAVNFEQLEQATTLLQRLVALPVLDEESRTLHDQAWLALASLQLAQQQYQQATLSLQNVRLKSPFTQQAFYSYGWALYESGQINQAMVPWQKLANQPESQSPWRWQAQLALASALEQQKNPVALSYYLQAADRFKQQQQKLEQLALSFTDEYTQQLLDTWAQTEDSQLNLSQKSHQGLFTDLLVSDELHALLKNYQQLDKLTENLAQNSAKLAIFSETIATRSAQRQQQLTEIQGQNFADTIEELQLRAKQLSTQIDKAQEGAPELLANQQQLGWLSSINNAQQINQLLSATRDTAYNQQRLARISGVLRWQIEQEYPNNLWQAKKSMQVLNDELEQMRALFNRLNGYAAQPENLVPKQQALSELTSLTQVKLTQAQQLKTSVQQEFTVLLTSVVQHFQQQLKQLYAQSLLAITRIKDQNYQTQEAQQ